MPNEIEKFKSCLIIGHAALGYRGGAAGSEKQQVHDGDTVNVRAVGNFGVHLLSVDAPEISFMLPGKSKFTGLSNMKCERFLSDPFSQGFPPFYQPLDQGLIEYIQIHAGAGAAINQHYHAIAAEDALEEEVLKDLEVLGKNENDTTHMAELEPVFRRPETRVEQFAVVIDAINQALVIKDPMGLKPEGTRILSVDEAQWQVEAVARIVETILPNSGIPPTPAAIASNLRLRDAHGNLMLDDALPHEFDLQATAIRQHINVGVHDKVQPIVDRVVRPVCPDKKECKKK